MDKQMEKEVIITWDKDIQKNKFKCSCGNLLIKNGKFSDTVLLDNGLTRTNILCGRCHRNVAYFDGAYSEDDLRQIVSAFTLEL